MNRKVSHKERANRTQRPPHSSGGYAESAEVRAWKQSTGRVATQLCCKIASLLCQAEAVLYSSDIPETAELMRSDLSEMVILTWNTYERLKTLTYGSEAWSKISKSDQDAIRDWMHDAALLIDSISRT